MQGSHNRDAYNPYGVYSCVAIHEPERERARERDRDRDRDRETERPESCTPCPRSLRIVGLLVIHEEAGAGLC